MDLLLEMKGNSLRVAGQNVMTEVSFLSQGSGPGSPQPLQYQGIQAAGAGSVLGSIAGSQGGAVFRLTDAWEKVDLGVRLTRRIELSGGPATGINARITFRLGPGRWKFFIPAACYDSCPNERDSGYALVSEERTSAPLVMAYDEESGDAVVLIRLTPAKSSMPRARAHGETAFLHTTQLGGIGYARAVPRGPALMACLPYAEAPSSRMLGKSLQGFTAFLPSSPQQDVMSSWLLSPLRAGAFDEACLAAYQLAHDIYRPEPPDPGLDLLECIRLRTSCLAELVRDWSGYTGLALNFDPRIGVHAPPSGYGTAFNSLASEVFPSVLEYGFTGRQLNNALMLHTLGARSGLKQWTDAATRVVGSFLAKCVTPSGFLNTLYDVNRQKAISPFGDSVGSQLHYGLSEAEPGNYVRNMAEAGFDLCLLSGTMQDPAIRRAALGLGEFLLQTQNLDGSWYRAYTAAGRPILSPARWFGAGERANKSSTSTAIPFLVRLHELSGESSYLDSARRAGDWLLEEVIRNIDYRGGTLDNPNVVDKEGMANAMTALVSLHQATGNGDYLAGAARAGGMALTWNYLWDVPFEEGTRLRDCRFASRGWGGISILWGAGVVDNYSLWFLPGWRALSSLRGNQLFGDISRLILYGTQQLLSLPGRMHGLVGVGMQEEGFACSDQGVDEGMIRKGDTWGALGWVFAAGTYGVWQALPGAPI